MSVLNVTLVCWEKTINFDKIIIFDIKAIMQFALIRVKMNVDDIFIKIKNCVYIKSKACNKN